MNTPYLLLFTVPFIFLGCEQNSQTESNTPTTTVNSSDTSNPETCAIDTGSVGRKIAFDENLPTIGVILFDDVLMTEITAPIDVFSKPTEDGKQLFNVVTIAATMEPVACESGLRVLPDHTFEICPKLDVLVVPSAYDMTEMVKNESIVDFIKRQNANSKFTMSNCAGSRLIGQSGIADGKKIVTYIGGGEDLKKDYPALEVQDDATISFVEDGKFLSSNGNLASYISALELLEKMTSKEHRKFVESYLYLERLQNWGK